MKNNENKTDLHLESKKKFESESEKWVYTKRVGFKKCAEQVSIISA